METLTIQFQNKLMFNEIPFFRGALLHALPEEDNLLLHNHVDDRYRYSYPLIQYKSIGGKAALVSIDEGIDAVMQLMTHGGVAVRIGNRSAEILQPADIQPKPVTLSVAPQFHKYILEKWIPLNEENYQRYVRMERMIDRIAFLENILTANILSFLKGVGVYIEDNLQCHILNLSQKVVMPKKGVRMLAFDADFRVNMLLPEYIGLGKHVSVGYGVVVKQNNKSNK